MEQGGPPLNGSRLENSYVNGRRRWADSAVRRLTHDGESERALVFGCLCVHHVLLTLGVCNEWFRAALVDGGVCEQASR